MKTLFRRSGGASAGDAVVAVTEREDGDFHLHRTDPRTLARRQRALNGRPWAMVDQVHGVAVHTVAADHDADPIGAARLDPADVVSAPDGRIPVAVWAADCAPLVLLGRGGAISAAHAGWRGLAGGVVDRAVREIIARGDTVAAAVLGPVIHPCCYRFGAPELERVARGVGVPARQLAGRTAGGAPSLDVPGAVAAALRRHRVELDVVGPCTACDRRWYSHRRGDAGRHAVVAWQVGERGRS